MSDQIILKYNSDDEHQPPQLKQNCLHEIEIWTRPLRVLQTLQQRKQRLQVSHQQATHLRMYLSFNPEYCSVKFMNAYAYAFDILQDGGIARMPES